MKDKMTTLKENITKMFDFDYAKFMEWYDEQHIKLCREKNAGPVYPSSAECVIHQHNKLKSEVLPILLECVEALEKANKKLQEINEMFVGQNMEVTGWNLNHTTEPLDNFFEQNNWEPENEALERLRKWSET